MLLVIKVRLKNDIWLKVSMKNRYITTVDLLLHLLLWNPSSVIACPFAAFVMLGLGAGLSFSLWSTLLQLWHVCRFWLYSAVSDTWDKYDWYCSSFIIVIVFDFLCWCLDVNLCCSLISMLKKALYLRNAHSIYVHLTCSWYSKIVGLHSPLFVFDILWYVFV